MRLQPGQIEFVQWQVNVLLTILTWKGLGWLTCLAHKYRLAQITLPRQGVKYPTQVHSGAAIDFGKAKILQNLIASVAKLISRSSTKSATWPQVFYLKHSWCRILSWNCKPLYFVIFFCQSSFICAHCSFLQKYLHRWWCGFFCLPKLWKLSMDWYFVTLIRTWDEAYWGDLTSSHSTRYFGISNAVWVKTK